MRRPRENSWVIPVLRYLGETIPDLLELGVKIAVDPGQLVREMFRGGFYSPRITANRVGYFKKSKYFRETNQKNRYELTSAGRVAVIRIKIRDKIEHAKEHWDGMYRAVGFDVLEERRRDRALLRQELRALGLIEVQHSLWMTPVDISAELLFLLKLWKSEFAGDVRVFLVKEMYPDKDIQRKFGLS